MLIEISAQTKIRSISCIAETTSVMFGRIGKMLFFCPDRTKSFCASLTPFVSGGVFVMLFEGVLVDEGPVAGMAGDAHGGWWLHSKTLCKEKEGSPLSIYNSWCLWWLGPFFHASRLCRGGGEGTMAQWMEASGSPAAGYVVKYRRAMSKINLSAFLLLQHFRYP